MLVKWLMVLVMPVILASMGSGVFFLIRDKGDSRRLVRALTVRIALSVVLFVVLLVAWYMGLIHPHGLAG